jgi:hypothetical protein
MSASTPEQVPLRCDYDMCNSTTFTNFGMWVETEPAGDRTKAIPMAGLRCDHGHESVKRGTPLLIP